MQVVERERFHIDDIRQVLLQKPSEKLQKEPLVGQKPAKRPVLVAHGTPLFHKKLFDYYSTLDGAAALRVFPELFMSCTGGISGSID